MDVYFQVQKFLDDNGNWSKYGFTKGELYLTHLIFLLDFKYYDTDNSTDIIYLEFSKSFDVSLKKLITKLEGYRILRNASRWIAGWMVDRKQWVQCIEQMLEMVYLMGLF